MMMTISHALQHNGQEGAGIVTVHNDVLQSITGVGLVSDVFNETKLDQLPGNLAIGHVRYSTTGQSMLNEVGASMKVAALCTLSYTLKTLGEVPLEFKEVLDTTVVAAVSHSSKLVRIEATLALLALAEVDPPCVGGLTSYGVTTLAALRECISFEKGSSLQFELDSLHGQATVLAALVSISQKLPLGYPARFFHIPHTWTILGIVLQYPFYHRLNLLELGFAGFLFICGCYDYVHGKNNYFVYLFLQTITFLIVGFLFFRP